MATTSGDTTRPVSDVPASPEEQRLADDLLAEARAALEEERYEQARATAQAVVDRYPGADASTEALLVAGRAALALGDQSAAALLAGRYLELVPAGSAEARAGRALLAEARGVTAEDTEETPEAEPRTGLLLGAILTRTGPPLLQRYAELVEEGIRLAVEEVSARTGRPIELRVLDDAGDPARAGTLLAQLEDEGAVGVVGPLLPEALRSAAEARTDPRLPILSPTASRAPGPLSNVHALSAPGVLGARALAEYALAQGVRRAAVLYPLALDYQIQAEAFALRLEEAGAETVLRVPYDSGTTNFAAPITRVADVAPEALFVPAPERDIRQLAPQLAFYGLRAEARPLVLGNDAWTSPEVLATVESNALEGVVAALALYRPGEEHGWAGFVELYERSRRRSLENAFPALGYDAAGLILAAAEAGAGGPQGLGGLARYRGATGVFIVGETSLERDPYLVRIQERQLVPVRRPGDGPGAQPE